MNIRSIIKRMVPEALVVFINRNRIKKVSEKYKHLSTKEIFTKIYSEHTWGNDNADPGSYFSGGGSHDAVLIDPYINAVKQFIAGLNSPPDVMDLGCGDFNIGSKLRPLCNRYIACDIVEPLIVQNKKTYAGLNVDFRIFDLTSEKCEQVDIIFVRQVLQHLSNEDIKKGLQNIIPYCKYLVLTEHVPAKENFNKNLDKPTGPDIRALLNSGIDITAPPFNYDHLKGECICEIPDVLGKIQTIVYKCN